MNQADASEPPSTRLGVVILAAGQGRRMKSSTPKVLQPVAGRTMIEHVVAVAGDLNATETIVVVSPHSDDVRAALNGVTFVEQRDALGTGHAVLQARASLEGRVEAVLVLYGDTPLVRAETARRLIEALGDNTIGILT